MADGEFDKLVIRGSGLHSFSTITHPAQQVDDARPHWQVPVHQAELHVGAHTVHKRGLRVLRPVGGVHEHVQVVEGQRKLHAVEQSRVHAELQAFKNGGNAKGRDE